LESNYQSHYAQVKNYNSHYSQANPADNNLFKQQTPQALIQASQQVVRRADFKKQQNGSNGKYNNVTNL
jgi:hypothetical protein